MDFRKRIKTLRLQRGMTLEDVGNKVGVGKSTVRKWENGDIENMGRNKIELLANALGVSPAYLMGWTDENGKPGENDALWEKREALRRDPNRRMLFSLAKYGTDEEVNATVKLIDALKATNPDFYDGDDPA